MPKAKYCLQKQDAIECFRNHLENYSLEQLEEALQSNFDVSGKVKIQKKGFIFKKYYYYICNECAAQWCRENKIKFDGFNQDNYSFLFQILPNSCFVSCEANQHLKQLHKIQPVDGYKKKHFYRVFFQWIKKELQFIKRASKRMNLRNQKKTKVATKKSNTRNAYTTKILKVEQFSYDQLESEQKEKMTQFGQPINKFSKFYESEEIKILNSSLDQIIQVDRGGEIVEIHKIQPGWHCKIQDNQIINQCLEGLDTKHSEREKSEEIKLKTENFLKLIRKENQKDGLIKNVEKTKSELFP